MPDETNHGQDAPSAEQRLNIGGFEIIEKIGQGGMGTVYKARQISMDRIVALKVLPRRLAGNKSYVQRFVREARAAAKLNHPNIVQGIDVGKSGGYYYFAMEYIDGETAADKVRREGPLDEEGAIDICLQAARALAHAHSRANIIHRDVKPQNILLNERGTAKLADLGLARHTEHDDASLTSAGTTLGTPDYISPEQIRGDADLDGRCDIYSLGATLYHLLVGRPPYTGESSNVVMAKHLTEAVPDPTTERPGLSSDTAAIIWHAMQKDRARRYQTADVMAEAMEAARRRSGEMEHVPPVAYATPVTLETTTQPRRKKPVPIGLLLAVIIAAAAGIAVFLATRPEQNGTKPQTTKLIPPPTRHPAPPGPSVKKPPKPPDGSTPDTARPGQKAYEFAKALAQEREADPWALIPQLRRILDDNCRGTEYEDEVRALLNQAEKNLRAAVDKAVKERLAQANALCEKNQYAAALAVFDAPVPERLRHYDWQTRFRLAAAVVLRKAERAWLDKKRTAQAAADKGNFDEAAKVMQDVMQWGLPRFQELAQGHMLEWQRKNTLAQVRTETDRLKMLFTCTRDIVSALQERNYAQARRLVNVAAGDSAFGKEQARFKLLAQDIQSLESLWQEAERRLCEFKPGDHVRVNGIMGEFESFRNGTVTAKGLRPQKLMEMREADLFHLLDPYFQADAGNPAHPFRSGLFHTFDQNRDLEKARKEFDSTEALGGKDEAERGREYIELLARLGSELATIGLLEEAERNAADKRWDKLEATLKKLDEHQDTEACRLARPARDELLQLAITRGGQLVQGLLGSYYRGMRLDRFKRTEVAPNIAFRGDLLPRAAGEESFFSVRWKGYIRIEEADTYQFGLTADGGFRFSLDDRLLLNQWGNRASEDTTRPIQLDAGFHKISIDYFHGTGKAYIYLSWRRDRGKVEYVPAEVLFHAAGNEHPEGER